MDAKVLSEAAWKATAQKFKIKDAGLQKALFLYENINDNYADELKGLAGVIQAANTMKKAKDAAAAPAVVKYLTDMINAAQAQQREVTKAKALAEKADIAEAKAEALQAKAEAMQAKADAEAAKREEQEQRKDELEQDEDEDEDSGDHAKRLWTAFTQLKGAKGVSYEFIVCDAKPHYGLMLAKKITPKHKEELSRVSGGSKRFLHVGTCYSVDGRLPFTMDKPVTGLARKLQDSFKHA